MNRLEVRIDRVVLPAGSALDASTVAAAIEAELANRLGVPAAGGPRSRSVVLPALAEAVARAVTTAATEVERR